MDPASFAPTSLSDEIETKKRRRDPLEEHEKRTVFVLNLPTDVTQRELHNMFYFWPGFMKCSIWRKEEKTNAFVLFETSQAAIDARDRLARYVFDSEQECVLHTKLALKNLVLTRDERVAINEQRMKSGAAGDYYQQQQPQQWGAFHPGMAPEAYPQYTQDQAAAAYGAYAYGQQQQYNPYGTAARGAGGFNRGAPRSRRHSNLPCNTLFLAKIESLTEEAIIQFIRMNCTGYKDHKFAQDRSGQRVAFFEFTSIENATESLTTINGHQGIQAAFAKNSLNQRRY